VLYAGEELGLEDAVVPPQRRVDPGGRDGCRAPIPWTGEPGHGWGVEDAWLPWPPSAEHRNVAALRGDGESILHLYRRVLAARQASAALRVGDFEWVDGADPSSGVLAWRRWTDSDVRVVAVNMGEEPGRVQVAGRVAVASDGRGEGSPFEGVLAPDSAVLIVPD
jgi:alpha-glucosidase